MQNSGRYNSQRENAGYSSKSRPRGRKRSMRQWWIVAVFLALIINSLANWANKDRERVPPAATSTVQRIEITQSAMQHIIDRHTVGGSINAGKSVFNAGEDIQALIKYAEPVQPVPQENGNYQRVVNAGRVIGIDRHTGQQTSTYTVITIESEVLVTAFPGMP